MSGCDVYRQKITRIHISRMRTGRSLTVSRRVLGTPPATMHALPQPCTPLQQLCMPPSNHTFPSDTHTCKNITLPQTSFAGSNNKKECIPVECVPSAAVAVCWRGVCQVGGVCPWGCLPGGYDRHV